MKVATFRTHWLAGSETFVRNEVGNDTGTEHVAVGLVRVNSSLARSQDICVFGDGRLARVELKLFTLTRWSPRLARVLRSTGATVVHAHFAYDAALVSATARRANLPLVVTVHGYDVTVRSGGGLRARVSSRRVRSMFRYASLVLAVSDFIRDKAIDRGALPERTRVQHLGIPILADDGDEPLPAEFNVCFVGRLVEKKGIFDLLTALSMLSNGVNCKAVIVGDGPLLEAATARAAELGVNALFVGFKGQAEVRSIMRRSAIVVVPSVTASNGDSEGLPTVVLEAGMAARPVVAYSHAGIPEAVLHENTGLLVPEQDVHALSECIERLIVDSVQARVLGESARRHILRNYDWSQLSVQRDILIREYTTGVVE